MYRYDSLLLHLIGWKIERMKKAAIFINASLNANSYDKNNFTINKGNEQ